MDVPVAVASTRGAIALAARVSPTTRVPLTRTIFIAGMKKDAGSASVTRNALKINPPYVFDHAEMKAFRRVCAAIQGKRELSPFDIDVAADYVRLGARLTQLHLLLDQLTADGPYRVPERRFLAINKQIDATTALSMRLADRLGLGGPA